MTAIASTVAPLPSTIIKMEDRKRPAGQNVDDLAPPTKRQAVNGTTKVSGDSDLPWKDELEKYQKDAIYRQMLEYKREKSTLEAELRDVQKRATDHDDHLRIVDAWWSQLLDEVTILAQKMAKEPRPAHSEGQFPTALLFKNSTEFSVHLSKKAKEIRSRLEELFSSIFKNHDSGSDDLDQLRNKLASLHASQKEQMVKYDRIRAEKDEISERLETASLRYLKAEKRLDRAKSAQVAKMEAQAYAGAGQMGSNVDNESGLENKMDLTNGIKQEEPHTESSQVALKEATVAVAKQKEQLESVLEENKSLQEQLTTATIKLTNLTDDDYARTDLFKAFKTQHEDVIKRINHLEATNIQLREEAEKLQAERTAFRNQLEIDCDITTGDLEGQLQRMDADLTRIRATRDELAADQSTRKAHQDQERVAIDQVRELAGAKDDRITSLESELQRLRAELDPKAAGSTTHYSIDDLQIEELRAKYITLEQNFASVNNELPAMEKAYKRSMALASKKVMDFAALEDKVTMLIAEKSKADQKYFAARRDMDTRISEVKTIRAQNAKSSEIISQLKDVESSNRSLLTSLEKQLSELRQANALLVSENKKLGVVAIDATSKTDALRTQATELTNLVKLKDSAYATLRQHSQSVELSFEKLTTRHEQAQKEKETWKAKSLSNQSGEEEMLRALALCTICRKEFKNTALKTCGHIFCKACVDDRITNRYRKCPNCQKGFDKLDVMTIHM